jgi:hypothetical protein
MAQLYDARANEILVGFADQVNGGVVTDGRTATNTLNAVNAEVIMDLNGAVNAAFDVRSAAGVLTFVVEATLDGTNYFALPMFVFAQSLAGVLVAEQYVASVTVATTLAGQYLVSVAGFRRVRLRVSAFTSGGITVAARATRADYLIYTRPVPSILHVTSTAAANTAATATLPAVAGLFHYITNIHLTRNATAVLAGTATLVATSTNLPGNPAWSYGNAMVAGGSSLDLNYSPTTPLKSLLANTATTVVMPAAGLAVLNRVNVSYYLGS